MRIRLNKLGLTQKPGIVTKTLGFAILSRWETRFLGLFT